MAERRAYTDAQVEAAIEALADPARLEEAQRMVGANAPGIQRILNEALQAADWFGSAHQAAVLEAAGKPDIEERLSAVRTLIAEETGVSMLIGVSLVADEQVGLGLATLEAWGQLTLGGPLDGEWWRAVTTQFIYHSTGYEVAALAAIAIFGTLLERRHGGLGVARQERVDEDPRLAMGQLDGRLAEEADVHQVSPPVARFPRT